jgi:hypothetical protein
MTSLPPAIRTASSTHRVEVTLVTIALPSQDLPGEQPQGLLAGDVPAGLVHERDPVRVAVVRDPEVGPDRDDRLPKVGEVRLRRFRRVAGEVAVGVRVQRRQSAAERPEELRARGRARPVPAVEDDPELPGRDPRAVDAGDDRLEVPGDPVRVGPDGSGPFPDGERVLAEVDVPLDRVLLLGGDFHPFRAAEFDPIEIGGVVGRSDHQPEARLQREDVELEARGRHRPQLDDLDRVHREDPGEDPGDPRARGPVSLGDEDRSCPPQDLGGRRGDLGDEHRREVGVDDPPDPVGPEEAGHGGFTHRFAGYRGV